jgi:hypothetical protein
MTSSVSGGNAYGSKPPPETATCKGYANVESESEAEARTEGPIAVARHAKGYEIPARRQCAVWVFRDSISAINPSRYHHGFSPAFSA